jgi:hypothetical protein
VGERASRLHPRLAILVSFSSIRSYLHLHFIRSHQTSANWLSSILPKVW